MKLRFSSHSPRRAVALVVTLILLSVILVVTIALLAISRRERSSVNTAQQLIDAEFMANSALERAKAVVASRILAYTNMAAGSWGRPMRWPEVAPGTGFDPVSGHDGGNLIVSTSTNSINPSDYTPGYLASLHFDPRPPVFIATNLDNTPAPLDFRYYLDLNRNGRFESNGIFKLLDKDGKPYGTNRYWHSGDPEWIGVLEHANAPHSATNRFVGRYAFLVLPAGRALDINSIHNNARAADLAANSGDGYQRNQGVGTYEINLAAFLADLNVNYWSIPARPYSFDLPAPYGKGNWNGSGVAFDDARSLIKFRYAGSHTALPTLQQWFGDDRLARIRSFLSIDYADWYADDNVGTIMDQVQGRVTGNLDNDVDLGNGGALRWPGVESPNRFQSINDLYKGKSGGITKAPYYGDFSRNLLSTSTNRSTYDRYTFYRLLSQLSTDSGTGPSDRIHLNFKNTEGTNEADFIRWTPTEFFNTVADRLIRETFVGHHTNDYYSPTNMGMRFDPAKGPLPAGAFAKAPVFLTNLVKIDSLSVSNIPVYPTNYYNVALHRLLQVAANLHEANTNRVALPMPAASSSAARLFPTIYRPIFRRSQDGDIVVSGYTEDDGTLMSQPQRWKHIEELAVGALNPNDVVYVYGVPPIVAARKGFPSLNEVSMLATMDVIKKLLITKTAANENLREKLKPSYLREMSAVAITNIFGVELLNSYTSPYPRNLRIELAGRLTTALSFNGGNTVIFTNNFSTNITYTANTWTGSLYGVKGIRVPLLLTNVVTPWATFLTNGVLNTNVSRTALFGNAGVFSPYLFSQKTTNELRLLLIDTDAGRVVDVVSLNRLETPRFDAYPKLLNLPDGSWQTNYERRFNVPLGDLRQIDISLESYPTPPPGWIGPSGWNEIPNSEKLSFRNFYEGNLANTNISKQVPWTPYAKLYQVTSWQVNDPLVHYMVDHMRAQTPGSELMTPAGVTYGNPVPNELPLTATNGLGSIPEWNVGTNNVHVTPWYRGVDLTQDVPFNGLNPTVKDPLVRTPDEWSFPTNSYPSLGAIGAVHRGTPWQTIFLKAANNIPDAWSYEQMWLEHVGSDVAHAWRSNPNDITEYRTNYLSHPTNDWLLIDYLKATPSAQAETGAIGVNQDGMAAWSAVLSGVVVLTNAVTAADVAVATNASFIPAPVAIQPVLNDANPPLLKIVNGINRTRAQSGGLFQSLGQILSVPELSVESPYLNRSTIKFYARSIPEDAFEAIPRRVASLIRKDQSRYEIYAFGQALQPAADGFIKNPLDPNYNLCTNYQVVAEMNTRTVLRFENLGPQPVPSTLVFRTNVLKPVVEKFQSLSED